MSDEPTALAELLTLGQALADGVEAALPGWVSRSVEGLADAWGGLDVERRTALAEEARTAGGEAARRVGKELRALLRADPAEQRATPLEVLRGAGREPSAVLRAAGVPPVRREQFAERAFPDDEFGLTPRTVADLGDPSLTDLHLAWGVAKALVLGLRRMAREDPAEPSPEG